MCSDTLSSKTSSKRARRTTAPLLATTALQTHSTKAHRLQRGGWQRLCQAHREAHAHQLHTRHAQQRRHRRPEALRRERLWQRHIRSAARGRILAMCLFVEGSASMEGIKSRCEHPLHQCNQAHSCTTHLHRSCTWSAGCLGAKSRPQSMGSAAAAPFTGLLCAGLPDSSSRPHSVEDVCHGEALTRTHATAQWRSRKLCKQARLVKDAFYGTPQQTFRSVCAECRHVEGVARACAAHAAVLCSFHPQLPRRQPSPRP